MFNVVNGPDGALWLTPNLSSPNGTIGRITTSGAFSQFTPPGGYFPGGPIVTGPDGNLWLQIFSENQTAIDQLTPSGISTVYALGETDGVYGMAVGSDGAIWLAEGDRIGRITTAGVYTHFSVGNYYPFAITSGSDGNLWFLALNGSSGASVIGQITTAGVSEIFPFSGELPIYAVSPIAAGPDGAIWFTIYATSGAGLAAIGKITTAGVISIFNIPNTSAYNFGESSIAASPDGGLWFTGDGALGRITTTGTATVYPLPATSFSTYAGATGQGLVAGPDGAMWFGVYGNNEVGRATLSASTAPVITQITPASIAAGTSTTTLRILGSNLAGSTTSPCAGSAETVTWNGTPLMITSAAAGEIDVTVPANLLASAGQFTVMVSVNQVSGSVCQALTASSTVQVTSVSKMGTSTQLTASPNPALATQTVTLTATVTPTTTGSVVFYDGAASIGTVSLSAGVATLSMEFTAGSHSLTATFSGNASYTSSATTPFSLQVNPGPPQPSMYFTAAPSSQSFGSPVTPTATLCGVITPCGAAAAGPIGSVTFLDGTTEIGSSQVVVGAQSSGATISISTLAVGTHDLQATDSGDAYNGPSQASVQVIITSANTPAILSGGIAQRGELCGGSPRRTG